MGVLWLTLSSHQVAIMAVRWRDWYCYRGDI